MQLTDRDIRILKAVHAYDGVLADYQIQRLFFTGKSQMQHRTMLLFQHGYLNRPDRRQRAALPCLVYWLSKKGAAFVAGLSGEDGSSSYWRRPPRWNQIMHDLALNDLRIILTTACERHQGLTLDTWLGQREFLADTDQITYRDRTGRERRRLMRPDGYFVIRMGKPHFPFLLELDRRTEDNPRFMREKVYPGVAYLGSPAYVTRFGYNAGRWLVVTTGTRRRDNMKRQAERAVGAQAALFYFTTFDQIRPETVLTEPIWYRGGIDKPITLLPSGY